ncbi:hypothetical protein AWC38_SpisGene21052 [Stylophora pistillata]|uniref:Uncharacterized protein n=1 Tax=Stylophora pistillata TaxID=50429 RepID=A0A2B4RE59_STYPI|nr:hypothetical protein AWC38_SpisGene21052 [Stylophora pistillata]
MRALALIVIFGVSATFAFGDDEDVNQKNPWRPGKKDETYWLRDQLPVLESVKRQKGMWKPGKKAPETVKRQHTVWKPGKKGMGGVSPPAANIPFPRPGRKRLNYGREKALNNIVNVKIPHKRRSKNDEES